MTLTIEPTPKSMECPICSLSSGFDQTLTHMTRTHYWQTVDIFLWLLNLEQAHSGH